MCSKVKLLRRDGERKPDREIATDPGIVGHVSICIVSNYTVMKIYAPGDTGARAPIVPELFRAHCTTMEGARMLFRGFERIGDQLDQNAPTRKQEWAIEIMVEQPERMVAQR